MRGEELELLLLLLLEEELRLLLELLLLKKGHGDVVVGVLHDPLGGKGLCGVILHVSELPLLLPLCEAAAEVLGQGGDCLEEGLDGVRLCHDLDLLAVLLGPAPAPCLALCADSAPVAEAWSSRCLCCVAGKNSANIQLGRAWRICFLEREVSSRELSEDPGSAALLDCDEVEGCEESEKSEGERSME